MTKTWNSLEIVKLLAGAATPIVLALIAFWAAQQQWTNQTLTQKRIEVYNKAAPIMDDVVSYFFCVGKWAIRSNKVIETPDVTAAHADTAEARYWNAVFPEWDEQPEIRRLSYIRDSTEVHHNALSNTIRVAKRPYDLA